MISHRASRRAEKQAAESLPAELAAVTARAEKAEAAVRRLTTAGSRATRALEGERERVAELEAELAAATARADKAEAELATANARAERAEAALAAATTEKRSTT